MMMVLAHFLLLFPANLTTKTTGKHHQLTEREIEPALNISLNLKVYLSENLRKLTLQILKFCNNTCTPNKWMHIFAFKF